MEAKNEAARDDCVLVDSDVYIALLDMSFNYMVRELAIRKLAEGWKSLNGAHRSYGDAILRILDENV